MSEDAAEIDAAPPASGLAALAREIRASAKADSVFGTPIRHGDTTIVPVAKAAFGLGGGRSARGGGAGGGSRVKPVGYVVLDASGVRFTALIGAQVQAALFGLALGLWLGRRRRRRRG